MNAVQSVDADAFGKVETHGIDAIPAAERHGRPRELGFLWAGAFANYASLFTASLLTTYYGLGVWDGLAATVLGTVAAGLILGLLSNTGPRSGLPQIVFTRGIFGRRGSYVGAALTLFLAVGWFAVDCVIAANAGAQLFGGGNRVITFGLAGATDSHRQRGQLIVATGAVQHDMDARPLARAKGIVPSLGKAVFAADPTLSEGLRQATEQRTMAVRDAIGFIKMEYK